MAGLNESGVPSGVGTLSAFPEAPCLGCPQLRGPLGNDTADGEGEEAVEGAEDGALDEQTHIRQAVEGAETRRRQPPVSHPPLFPTPHPEQGLWRQDLAGEVRRAPAQVGGGWPGEAGLVKSEVDSHRRPPDARGSLMDWELAEWRLPARLPNQRLKLASEKSSGEVEPVSEAKRKCENRRGEGGVPLGCRVLSASPSAKEAGRGGRGRALGEGALGGAEARLTLLTGRCGVRGEDLAKPC